MASLGWAVLRTGNRVRIIRLDGTGAEPEVITAIKEQVGESGPPVGCRVIVDPNLWAR